MTDSVKVPQKQNLTEWQKNNAPLVKKCQEAAQALGPVQQAMLARLAEKVIADADEMTDSEFVLHEFIDTYGPRFVQFQAIIQSLVMISTPPAQ